MTSYTERLVIMTVHVLIDLYMANRLNSRSKTKQEFIAQWWITQWGLAPVESLTHREIFDMAHRIMQQGNRETTMVHYLKFFRQACIWGVTVRHLLHNPCAGFPLPKERPGRYRILTDAEEERLALELGSPAKDWMRFALLTGLRPSEQFPMRWADVDLSQGVLLLTQTATSSVVTFTLPPEAVQLLTQWRTSNDGLWVFPNPYNARLPMDFRTFCLRIWEPAVTASRLPRLTWKDLRHTCGARLVQQGLPMSAIQHGLRVSDKKYARRYRASLDLAGMQARPLESQASPFSTLKPEDILAVMERDRSQYPVTIGELARLYATQCLGSRPSRDVFDRCYRQFWLPWADRPIASISRKMVVAWFMGLSKTPAHANHALMFFRRLYNWGFQYELVDCPNPTEKIPMYPRRERERFLTLEEATRMFDALSHAPQKLRVFVLLLLYTGCRSGEARTLRWSQIDWKMRLWRKPRTKNGRGQLTPLARQVMDALHELPRTSEYLFPGMEGKPWAKSSIHKGWRTFRHRIDLDDVTVHDLRRTCASYLSIAGENLPTIQNVLNHKSLGPTSVYARLNVQAVDRALQQQADRFSSLSIGIESPGSHQAQLEHRNS
jgi:integrase